MRRNCSSQSGILEPFNKRRYGGASDSAELNEQLIKRFQDYDFLKHLYNQLSLSLNLELIKSNYYSKIIFLYRKNLLAAAISQMIAQQKKNWNRLELSLLDNLNPLSLDKLRTWMDDYYRSQRDYYLSVIQQSNKDYYMLAYEDFYGFNVTLDEKLSIAEEIASFVGFQFDKEKLKQYIQEKMLPDSKFNTKEHYNKVPNIDQIREVFEGSRYGYLFEPIELETKPDTHFSDSSLIISSNEKKNLQKMKSELQNSKLMLMKAKQKLEQL
jgi:hypothetical protein